MIHIDQFEGKRLHFTGIGGCSMSGLASICKHRGYIVTGSDRNASPFTRKVCSEGIPVQFEQKEGNVHGADLLIYSAAIKSDNPERAEAEQLGIPQMERSVLLGQLSSQYDEVVCISGCHGKTTITSMLALMTIKGGLNPTIHIGGMVDFLGGGVRTGSHSLFITEACEYVDSFLTLEPTSIVLNNIDDDHLDYFRDMDHICQSFSTFVGLLPPNGFLAGYADDERVYNLLQKCKCTTTTYGLVNGDYRAANIQTEPNGHTSFDVILNGQLQFNAALQVPGNHNVINALATIVMARQLHVSDSAIIDALGEYTLTRRRFEHYGDVDGVSIYHDYAHHPNEIRACLQGARSVCQGKLWVVFQCNSYTRAKTLFTENVTCFSDADHVLVPDIYPGREVDTGIVHAEDMVAAIKKQHTLSTYLPTFEDISEFLHKNWQPNDMVVTLGSGDVYIQTNKIMN